MLIGIMSDSHDNLPMIKKAVEYFNSKKVDLVFHAGDIVAPFCMNELARLNCRMIAVFGNNDGEKRMWREKIKSYGEIYDEHFQGEYEGSSVILMHEPWQVEALVSSQKFDVIIYGHTHKPVNKVTGKTLVINPGECGGWLTGQSTVAILKLPEKTCEIVTLK
jgi:putative phosphoesterase